MLADGVVDFVGAALLGADAELVGVEAVEALAVFVVGVEGGVDGTGDAVAVADEVVVGTGLALAADESVAGVADAGVGRGAVDGVLAADEDAGVGLRAPEGTRRAFGAEAVVVG